ncbi:hypothetical protein UPYG_G00329690 [Umbra pygmaea]|uniref:trypsin n=1 Tax=Umbra pygmaea TaxID=75934 RepID=A0ABD0W666_UMBPY
MGNCNLLLILTTALVGLLHTKAGLQRQKRHTFLDFSSRRSDIVCLHGTPVSFGKRTFCSCADGYDGKHCEIDTSASCYIGSGIFYRGKVSQSESGRRCLVWDRRTRKNLMASDVHSGRHNYCRNLEYKQRPWCYVIKGGRQVQEYCSIPSCGIHAESPPTESPPTEAPPTETPPTEPTCGQRPRKQMKIVGGTIAAIQSHPWMAAIFWNGRRPTERVFHCGGSLISSCWVLTAAHCLPDGFHTAAQTLSVTLGKNAINETDVTKEQTFQVEEVIIHPEFDNSEGNFNNDIALLRLQAIKGQCAQESGSVRTVCLPPANRALRTGTSCEIAGYGKEEEGLWYNSQYLRQAKVELLAHDICSDKEYYGNMITENMFCAGKPDWSQDACKGDSGGPMVCEVDNRISLFGIVSWGEGCSRAFRPGVYTTVTKYNRWIEENCLSSLTSGSVFPK